MAKKQNADPVLSIPLPTKDHAYVTGRVTCRLCRLDLAAAFASTGELILIHDAYNHCPNAGKRYAAPIVELKEIP
jgi:hypothetical protein